MSRPVFHGTPPTGARTPQLNVAAAQRANALGGGFAEVLTVEGESAVEGGTLSRVPNAPSSAMRELLTGGRTHREPAFVKQPTKDRTPRIDRWTPRHKQGQQVQGDRERTGLTTGTTTTRTASTARDSRLFVEPDKEVAAVQKKIQEQLKGRRHFRVQTAGDGTESTLNRDAFQKTLMRYGLELQEHERDALFSFYDQDGTGELDYEEFMNGIRGTEFVQTAKSFGFETPDPGYHEDDPEGGFGHFVPVTVDLMPNTARNAKAWQQQRALDSCPFATDRRMFGGKWQYRTSSLIKAEPVVAPRYGKTSFPARKTLQDIVSVISDKLIERSKTTLAFTRLFNHFDTDKNGSIDRVEFEKLLEMYNITLNDSEIGELFSHFGAEDGGIKYRPFVKTVEDHRKKHPLEGNVVPPENPPPPTW